MDEIPVGADFERPTFGRNESERRNAFSEFKDLGRQTDGLRRVVSNYAIFDRHFGFHLELLSLKMVRDSEEGVKRGGFGGIKL